MARTNICDVLVVGGGVIGLSLAWRLAQRGLKVAVLDSGAPGGASRAAAGMLAPLAEAHSLTPFVQFGLDSLALYPAFLEELRVVSGRDVALAGPGMLRVAQTDAEADALHQSLQWQQSLGLPLEWLDADAARAREPALASSIVGAVHSACEQHVTPRRLLDALRRACRHAGATIYRGARMVGINTAGKHATGTITPTVSVHCAHLVLAQGAWTGEMSVAFGYALPITPLRGQALTLQTTLPLPFAHTLYGTHGYLVPRAEGRIVVGATEEQAGFDAATTPQGIDTLRAMATSLAPLTAPLRVQEKWAGLRPVTPDGLPLLGRMPGWDNVFVAAGHGRNGVLLTPLTAQMMAQAILDNAPLPAELAPTRFGTQP